jgi:hypothetical protein
LVDPDRKLPPINNTRHFAGLKLIANDPTSQRKAQRRRPIRQPVSPPDPKPEPEPEPESPANAEQ